MAHISQKSWFYTIGLFSLFLSQAQFAFQNLLVCNIPSRIENPFTSIGEWNYIIILESKPFLVLIRKETPGTKLGNSRSYQFFIFFPDHRCSLRHYIEISSSNRLLSRIFKEFFSLFIYKSIAHIIIDIFHLGCNRKVIENIFKQMQMFLPLRFSHFLDTLVHKVK